MAETLMNTTWSTSMMENTGNNSATIFNDSNIPVGNSTERFFNYATATYNILLLTTGCVGNILVLIVYGCRFKPSTFNIFIVFLAAMDLICCAIEMPLDAANMTHTKRFYGCKAIVSIATTTATATGLTLVAIAALRYRGICHPLKQNISMKHARVIVLSSLSFALCVSWPSGVIVTDQLEPIEGGYIVINCAPEDHFKDTMYPAIYNLCLFAVFITAFSALIILYLMVARKLWLRKKYGITGAPKKKGDNKENSSQKELIANNKGEVTELKTKTNVQAGAKNKSEDSQATKLKNQGMFKMLFVVSVMFLVSYLPHFSLMIYEAIAGRLSLTPLTESIVGIVIRSYLINSACNPIIYGCYSNKFRDELKQMFTRK